MYDKILVPMALDHGVSGITLKAAATLCNPGGQITALHVYEAPQGSVSAYLDEDAVREGLDKARQQLTKKTADYGDVTAEIVKGRSYRAIVEYAEQHGMDCIVVGSHKPGLSDFFLGSTAARVVRHAPCAVHVCRTL
ncbi:universal stress protein [Phaeobacter gallaeciensis]|uniref:Universal stress protein n=1 Tax=Phaeobacter gallaeciensis TaxID=60890 RepID=A0AAC9ZAC9_9RHOB|nr:universal stress protein [Phaeobacter gallaeciensis]AHD10453.1 Universal stress protein UspA [Phaeobacter gallaeciensis DSM 26640]ATE93716.1 universal stress protein [Phaeobacter gallaeciensis]ATE96463.1 universal stress protein [Phaeobacter gallaeciensis]ATF02380.1 universal stress protein [Phaeobacter gallaeciensis]ATF06760.1 universal stress protein [Phaeobacter gallaeciensis]